MQKVLLFAILVISIFSCENPPNSSNKENIAEQWQALFNGKDLSGWQAKITGYPLGENFGNTFRVEDGLLQVRYDQYDSFDNRFGHLFYQTPYSNYRLRIEYRFLEEQAPNGPDWAYKNSGVMIHGQTAKSMMKDQDFPISIEVQMLGGKGDSTERPTANLCTPGTDVMMDGKWLGQHCLSSTSETIHDDTWVTLEVLVMGDSLIEHLVNGKSVMKYSKPRIHGGVVNKYNPRAKPDGKPLVSGTISLQSESHPIDFRKVEILELPRTSREVLAEATSFTGKTLYPMVESPKNQQKKDSLLKIAKNNYLLQPNLLDHIIWYGRRTAYLSQYKRAIAIYSRGIKLHPNSPELYRHRGHRYLSTRRLDKAIADFEKAAALVKDRPIKIEPDGIPNRLNKPLSSLQFNIWYHWALAYYLKGDFEKAADLYEQCMTYSTNPDLLTATSDWLYMTYRKLGKTQKAIALLKDITADMDIIENKSYHNRLLMYKGEKQPEDLLDFDNLTADNQLDIVTQGYGVGNWYLYHGDKEKATAIFEKILETDYWAAFGYVAAEAELSR